MKKSETNKEIAFSIGTNTLNIRCEKASESAKGFPSKTIAISLPTLPI